MKTFIFSIAFTLILCSCDPHKNYVPNTGTENPCKNGAEYNPGVIIGSPCDCPEGYCGTYCDTLPERTLYGIYEGVMVCQGDSVVTDFKVEEYKCVNDDNFFGIRLLINDDLVPSYYWKTFENLAGTGIVEVPRNVGEIRINFGERNLSSPVNGRLTPDSLSFWSIEYEDDLDTCFYVGVKI